LTGIRAVGVVVPLAEVDEPGIREDITQVKRIAPAGVGENDIGDEAFILESQINTCSRLAGTHSLFHRTQIGVAGGFALGRVVT
jgi:hypothetical protein